MFLFLLRNPWQAHDTGHCCNGTFLYIIDDLGPSRQHQYASHIDYHAVRVLRSLNFPFLNRNNSLLSNKNSRRSKLTIVINILQRTKCLPGTEDWNSLKILILLLYSPLQPSLSLTALVMCGFADILIYFFLKLSSEDSWNSKWHLLRYPLIELPFLFLWFTRRWEG